jgi:hypothetical protein
MSRFDLSNYETVETRLAKFWEEYPNGRIHTNIYHYDENKILFAAEIYKDAADEKPVSTGYAEELRDASPVNRTSHVENAETSAIGRALANFKFQSKSAPRPSREEMQKVVRQQGEPQPNAINHPTQRTREQMINDANNKAQQIKERVSVTSITVTEAQLKLLNKLASEKSQDVVAFSSEVLNKTVEDIATLTKRDASTVINALMKAQ